MDRHSKICMITLQNRHGQLKTITQIGTGNYNEKTSKMYTDISYITSKDIIGKDAISFFQNMALGNLNGEYDQLIVSPSSLKQTCLQLIEREIKKVQSGKKGQILLKMNSMTDLDLMKKLQYIILVMIFMTCVEVRMLKIQNFYVVFLSK